MSEPPQCPPPDAGDAAAPPAWRRRVPGHACRALRPGELAREFGGLRPHHEPGGRPGRCGGAPAGAVPQPPADVAVSCTPPRRRPAAGVPSPWRRPQPCTCVRGRPGPPRAGPGARSHGAGAFHRAAGAGATTPWGRCSPARCSTSTRSNWCWSTWPSAWGCRPHAVWQVARLEVPVKQATLRVYGRLLATLGQAFLHTRYHTLLDAQRLAALEQRFQERTAALHTEIAERQRLEREAQRVQHFALLGRLAAGVSHEIRNPLAAVFLHVDLLAEELQQPSARQPGRRWPRRWRRSRPSSARLEDLVQDYLSLVRVGTIQPTPQDLGAAVQTWAAEFHALAAAPGRDAPAGGPRGAGAGGVSCGDTCAARCSTWCRMRWRPCRQGGRSPSRAGARPRRCSSRCRIRGVGSPPPSLAQIFEPLYTTKPGGTGLGLYIVQEIVAAHGGQVTVESVEGQGTTFTLTLPLGGRKSAAP